MKIIIHNVAFNTPPQSPKRLDVLLLHEHEAVGVDTSQTLQSLTLSSNPLGNYVATRR